MSTTNPVKLFHCVNANNYFCSVRGCCYFSSKRFIKYRDQVEQLRVFGLADNLLLAIFTYNHLDYIVGLLQLAVYTQVREGVWQSRFFFKIIFLGLHCLSIQHFVTRLLSVFIVFCKSACCGGIVNSMKNICIIK